MHDRYRTNYGVKAVSKQKISWSAENKLKTIATGALCILLLSGCEGSISLPGIELPSISSSEAESDDLAAINSAAAATAAVTKPTVKVVPTITGMGYASISSQPAKSSNQRRLMAIRAARLEAMRNLTEQVHGLKINSRTTIIDAIVQNDSLRATVEGTILGAKTVRINPVGSDTYEVVLELDQALIAEIMKAARG